VFLPLIAYRSSNPLPLQIAKSQGAFVATTCSTSNVEFVTKELGADQAIDYTKEKCVRKGRGVDTDVVEVYNPCSYMGTKVVPPTLSLVYLSFLTQAVGP
jgi:NADPH-dependent curcumin reductase CurA